MAISIGNNGNNIINGTSGSDILIGGNGNDTLNGGDGSDILIGGNGGDTLNGGSGNDLLIGGNGGDTLSDGSGNDIALGGNGKDTFIHSMSENLGYLATADSVDCFDGGNGKDTLILQLTANQMARADVQAAIAAFNASNKSIPFDFSHYVAHMKLTVVNIENLTIQQVANHAPVAGADSATTNEDTVTNVSVLGNDYDPDGDALTLSLPNAVSQQGVHVSLVGNAIAYDPHAVFNHLALGQTAHDQIQYQLSDGNGGITVGTVNVTITGANDAPVFSAVQNNLQSNVGQALNVVLPGATDVDDGDVLSYQLQGSLPSGLVFNANTHALSGAASVAGTYHLQYTVTDLAGASALETFDLNVIQSKPPLFTEGNDSVNFNSLSSANYSGSPYDALGGDDTLILPLTNSDISHSGLDPSIPLHGGDGNDTFSVGDSVIPLTLYGDAGNDTFNLTNALNFGNPGGTPNPGYTVYGGAGNDAINGSFGDDILDGGSGIDIIHAGAGNDTIIMKDDNLPNSGIETFDGGSETDTLDLSQLQNGKIIYTDSDPGSYVMQQLGGPSILDGASTLEGYALLAANHGIATEANISNMENLLLTSGNDLFTATHSLVNNSIIDAGLGVDSFSLTQLTTPVSVDLSNTDFQNTGAGLVKLLNFENVGGGIGNDVLIGNAGNNYIYGYGGNDTMTGGAGNDTFIFSGAGSGRDTITDFTSGQDSLVINNPASAPVMNSSPGSAFIALGGGDSITLQNFNGTLHTTQIDATHFIIS